MNIQEYLLRLLMELKPMLPGAITAIAATLAALVLLIRPARTTWVEKKSFGIAGLFFGLDRKTTLQLSCAWLKLIFLVVFLVGFQKLVLVQYLMLLIPGLLLAFTAGGRMIAGSLFWLMLQTAGLFCANAVCGYMKDVRADLWFVLIYIALALFLILFGLYLFLTELNTISDARMIDPEEIWGKKVDDGEGDRE